MKDTPEIGEPVCWTPAAFTEYALTVASFLGAETRVSGRIVYINEAHRFYRAEAGFVGGILRECFKF